METKERLVMTPDGNDFIPETPFEQWIYTTLTGLPCKDHEEAIKINTTFRDRSWGAYVLLGVLIGGGLLGIIIAGIRYLA